MIIGLSILIGLLIIGLIIAGIVIKNLLTQNDKFEEVVQSYSDKIEKVEEEAIKYHRYYLQLFTHTYQELERVNKRGSFSSDDEVGFAFRVILAAIENVKEKLKENNIEQEEVTTENK